MDFTCNSEIFIPGVSSRDRGDCKGMYLVFDEDENIYLTKTKIYIYLTKTKIGPESFLDRPRSYVDTLMRICLSIRQHIWASIVMRICLSI